MTVAAASGSEVKTYRISHSWLEATVDISVDHAVLTAERAVEINRFWTSHEERFAAADDDHVGAVIRLAGARLIGMVYGVVEYLNTFGMQREFDSQEGWGGSVQFHGISIIDFDGRPEVDSCELLVEEIEHAGGAA